MRLESIKGLALLGVWAGLLGCGPKEVVLEPQDAAREAAGPRDGAVAQVEGVEMVVDGDAWAATPPGLEEVMTPVFVNIDNQSDRPLRVRYKEFALVTKGDERHAAIPPFAMDKALRRTVPIEARPEFAYDRYYLAPYHADMYGPYGAELDPWNEPFAMDSVYYDTYYGYWPSYSAIIEIDLPTNDMIVRAIPEGVVGSGGSVSGFIYFEKVESDVPSVTYVADLVDARTGESFGTVTIPFEIETEM